MWGMWGYAPGWQMRCVHCGLTYDAADLGVVRFSAYSLYAYKLRWCDQCRGFRCFSLEHKPKGLPDHAGPRCPFPRKGASPKQRQ